MIDTEGTKLLQVLDDEIYNKVRIYDSGDFAAKIQENVSFVDRDHITIDFSYGFFKDDPSERTMLELARCINDKQKTYLK